jgi:hypothetical protein|tara:strand:- start:45 stop:911 length:867 start_codon:yes stop_codon:yes gene_type:complete
MKNKNSRTASAVLIFLLSVGDSRCEDRPHQKSASPAQGSGTLVFTEDFEGANPGIYTEDQLDNHWNNPLWSDGVQERRVSIVETEPGNMALAVAFPAHTFGPAKNGAQWKLDFDAPLQSVEVRYDIKFEDGFAFSKGGKLPGLFGGKGNSGGGIPTGRDGFSARMMWREDGRIVQYLYYPDQPERYGHQIPWVQATNGKPIQLTAGKWHTVVQKLSINTPGKKDGRLRAFFDGKSVLEINNLRLRDTDTFAIDGLFFCTFFGGGDASWATKADETIYFDNFQISAIVL